jgi:aryl-alcohol dehydrogenase-like predicted oxidoreductase
MKYRLLGNTNLQVSEIGVGGSRFGSMIEQRNQKEIVKMLQEALDKGINFYDTADSYGQGESEKLIGSTFKNKREQVIIATKAGYCLSPTGSFAAKIKPLLRPLIRWAKPLKKTLLQARSSQLNQNFSAEYLTQAVEASLKRLQTDYLDIFQLHDPPSTLLESGEVVATLETLKSQGKIRYCGAGCLSVEDAVLCLKYPVFSAVQVEINLLNQSAITKLLPLAKEKQVGVIARQAFASGALVKLQQYPNSMVSEKSEDSQSQERAKKFEKYKQIIQGDRTLTQLALQFLLQYDSVSTVIVGMSSQQHLEDNLKAIAAPPLTSEELAILN